MLQNKKEQIPRRESVQVFKPFHAVIYVCVQGFPYVCYIGYIAEKITPALVFFKNRKLKIIKRDIFNKTVFIKSYFGIFLKIRDI